MEFKRIEIFFSISRNKCHSEDEERKSNQSKRLEILENTDAWFI